MLAFIVDNIANIIVVAIIVVLLFLALRHMVSRGRSSRACGGCSHCSKGVAECHNEDIGKETVAKYDSDISEKHEGVDCDCCRHGQKE